MQVQRTLGPPPKFVFEQDGRSRTATVNDTILLLETKTVQPCVVNSGSLPQSELLSRALFPASPPSVVQRQRFLGGPIAGGLQRRTGQWAGQPVLPPDRPVRIGGTAWTESFLCPTRSAGLSRSFPCVSVRSGPGCFVDRGYAHRPGDRRGPALGGRQGGSVTTPCETGSIPGPNAWPPPRIGWARSCPRRPLASVVVCRSRLIRKAPSPFPRFFQRYRISWLNPRLSVGHRDDRARLRRTRTCARASRSSPAAPESRWLPRRCSCSRPAAHSRSDRAPALTRASGKSRCSSAASSRSGGNGQMSPAAAVRRRYSADVL